SIWACTLDEECQTPSVESLPWQDGRRAAAAGRWKMGGKGKPKQMQLQLPTWGGRRKRKRRRKEQRRLAKVPHRKRPALLARHPVHAMWRVLPHVWNLRSRRCFSRIAQSFSRGRDRFG